MALGALASAASAAPTLGPLSLGSEFGQPIRAEVEVTDLSPGEWVEGQATIAAPEVYRDLGVTYPASLVGASATLFPAGEGRWMIRIEGRLPVVEPDFNMVVTLNTPQGRQVRNYRLTQPGEPAPAAPPPMAAAPLLPQVQTSGPRIEPLSPEPGPQTPATTERVPTPSPRRAEEATVASRVTVVTGDTALALARRYKPEGVTEVQAAMALYRRNLDRFQGSVHRVRAGTVLELPDAEGWKVVSATEALAELRTQPMPVAVARAPAQAVDRLVLAGGSGRGESTAANTPARAVAHQAAMDEATSRIKELEAIVEKMKRLVEASDARVKTLQSEVERAQAATATAPVPATPAAPARPPEPIAAPPAAGVSTVLIVAGGLLLAALGVAAIWYRRMRAEPPPDLDSGFGDTDAFPPSEPETAVRKRPLS